MYSCVRYRLYYINAHSVYAIWCVNIYLCISERNEGMSLGIRVRTQSETIIERKRMTKLRRLIVQTISERQ